MYRQKHDTIERTISFCQFIPLKHTQFGIKACVLAESESRYVYAFSFYTGKTAEVQKDLSGTVVCSLITNLLNQGYRLYLDNLHMNAELLLYLYDNETYVTGTAHAAPNVLFTNRGKVSHKAVRNGI